MITLASIDKMREPTGFKPGPQINVTPVSFGNLRPKTVKHISGILELHGRLKHNKLVALSNFGTSTVSRVVFLYKNYRYHKSHQRKTFRSRITPLLIEVYLLDHNKLT